MTETAKSPELSVVILCYHSADVVRDLVIQVERELEDAGIDYELVLVGNYLPGDDKDPTPAVLKALAPAPDHRSPAHIHARPEMPWCSFTTPRLSSCARERKRIA